MNQSKETTILNLQAKRTDLIRELKTIENAIGHLENNMIKKGDDK